MSAETTAEVDYKFHDFKKFTEINAPDFSICDSEEMSSKIQNKVNEVLGEGGFSEKFSAMFKEWLVDKMGKDK